MPLRTDHINIETQKAIAAINNLSTALRKYNREVADSKTQQQKANRESEKAINQSKRVRRETVQRNRALREQTKNANQLLKQLTQIRQMLYFALGYRVFFGFIEGLKDSIGRVNELSIAVAEIRTISQSAKISTDEWTNSLKALSASYGVDVVNQAEAAYQTLSNQIEGLRGESVKLSTVQQFLERQTRLSIIAQTDMAGAVAATTSVLNGFQLDVSQTSRVNSVLFKTVELGRLRFDEMTDTLGRVNTISNQLGITFEEQQAALAVLTRQGIKFAEAVTLLRNLQLKLIKPSERLKGIFEDWGVTSGQNAIQTFGFAETLKKLAEEAENAGDFTAEVGEIFNRLRAQVGFAGLASSFDLLDETIQEMSTSGISAANAFEEAFSSSGRRVQRELERTRIYLTTFFGEGIQKGMLAIADSAGGADKALDKLLRTLSTGFAFFIAYRTTLSLINRATVANTVATAQATAQQAALNAQVSLSAKNFGTKLLSSFLNWQTVASAGVGTVVALYTDHLAQLTFLDVRYKSIYESAKAATSQIASAIVEMRSIEIDEQFQRVEKQRRENLQSLLQSVSETSKALNQLRKNSEDALSGIDSAISSAVKNTTKGARTHLQVLEKLNKEIENTLKTRGQSVREQQAFINDRRAFETATNTFSKSEKDAGLFDADKALKRIRQFIQQVREERNSLLREGRFDDGDFAQERVNKLLEQEVEFIRENNLNVSALRDIEADRRKQVEDRVAAEKEGLKVLEQIQQKQQEDLKQKQKQFEIFAENLAKLDSFTNKTDIKEFDTLLKQLQTQATQLGVSPEEQIKLLREARSLRHEIIKEQDRSINQQRTDRNRELLEQASQQEKEINEEIAETEKKRLDTVKQITAEVQGQIKLYQEQVKTLRSDTQGTKIASAFLSLRELEAINETLLGHFRSGSLETQTELLNKLTEGIIKFQQTYRSIDPDEIQKVRTLWEQLFFKGSASPQESRRGQLLIDDKDVGQTFKTFKDQLEELKTKEQNINDVRNRSKMLIEEINKLRKESSEIQRANLKIIETGMPSHLSGLREVNDLLQERINKLQQIRSLETTTDESSRHNRQNLAFGGTVGTDRIPTVLSPNETVMTAAATRQFGPLLRALNNTAPVSHNVSVGDINVNMPTGTTSDQVDEFVTQVKRRIRTGRWV